MEATATKKFNFPKTTTFIIMPLAFTGKDKRFKDLTNAYQFLLAEIYTANRAVKGFAKLTFDHFVQKFGMSRETVSDGLRKLEELGIIERLGNSRYKILVKFNTNDYIIIDDYLHKHLWNVGGVQKRLSRSRIKTLAFLDRSCSNPKTFGVFVSSQARIGVAINMPRTTAGDSIRELAAIGVIDIRKADPFTKETYAQGLKRYLLHPELKVIKRRKPEPPKDDVADVQKPKQPTAPAESSNDYWAKLIAENAAERQAEAKLEAVKAQLMQDGVYRQLDERLTASRNKYIVLVGLSAPAAVRAQAERELDTALAELTAYLKAHGVPPDIIKALI